MLCQFEVKPDLMGNLLITPVRKTYSHLSLFYNHGGETQEFLYTMSDYCKDSLNRGYSIRVLMSDEYISIMEELEEYYR